MLGINRKNNWTDRDSNPKPPAWERCCPSPTAAIYFWKGVGNFGLKKMTLLKEQFFLHITYAAKNNNEVFDHEVFPDIQHINNLFFKTEKEI